MTDCNTILVGQILENSVSVWGGGGIFSCLAVSMADGQVVVTVDTLGCRLPDLTLKQPTITQVSSRALYLLSPLSFLLVSASGMVGWLDIG